MNPKQERQRKEKQFSELVIKGIEGSYLKQKAVFERDEKTKAMYEEVKKMANF